MRLSAEDHFDEYAAHTGEKVRAETDELFYTGCDYTVNGRVRGHYYYTLMDGRCQFYILPARRGSHTGQPMSSAIRSRSWENSLSSIWYRCPFTV